MQAGGIERPFPNDLLEEASGAVVDRRTCYIGLIINTEERPFRTSDLPSFDQAIDLLTKAGVPIQEERSLHWAFWLAAGTGVLFILILWLAAKGFK